MNAKWMLCALFMMSAPILVQAEEQVLEAGEQTEKAAQEQDAGLQVDDAYAYPPIGAGKVGVAFMTLHNNTQQDYRLIAATSPSFGSIELHTHLYEDGLMKMREVEAINVSAGKSAALKPGGDHLMLFDPVQAIKVGDILTLTLRFAAADASALPLEQVIELPVKARSGGASAPSKAHGGAHDHQH